MFAQQLYNNPVRAVRNNLGLSLEGMAQAVGMHYQVVYLTECGCYSVPSDKILEFFADKGYNTGNVIIEYINFIKSQRAAFSEAHRGSGWRVPHRNGVESPLAAWRRDLSMSRSRLSKAICVQPAHLYRLETGRAKNLPSQVACALRDIGFDNDLLLEVELMQEDFFYACK